MSPWSPHILNFSSPTIDRTPDVSPSHNGSSQNNDERNLKIFVGASAYFSVAASSSSSECVHPVQHPRRGRSCSPHLLPILANDDGATKARGGNRYVCDLSEIRPLPVITLSAPIPTMPSEQAIDGLMTGKCATCGSLVRWPRHLHVFRCTACLMVNNLKLASTKPTDEDGLRAELKVYMDKTELQNQKLGMQRAGTILSPF